MTSKLILLKKDSDFSKPRFNKKPYSNNLMRVRVAFESNQNSPRFGFIIPKKVVSKVVERNRIKRRLKAILGKNQASIKPVDILIFPNKAIVYTPFMEVEKQTINLLKSANLWLS